MAETMKSAAPDPRLHSPLARQHMLSDIVLGVLDVLKGHVFERP
jgi:hypothetical protein